VQAPTYQEFRTWALSQGYTGRTLSPHVEADEPIKTATRILVFLTGTHWDDEPLPYPKLCQLYHGSREVQGKALLSPYPPLTAADSPVADIPREHRVWMALWDAGWSFEKIAATWNQSLELVEAVLDKLIHQPWPVRRIGTGDLATQEQAVARRYQIRRLFHDQDWTIEQLHQVYPVYSRAMLEKIIKQRAQATIGKTCRHCETPIIGKRSTKAFCSPECRRDHHRGQKRALQPA
jgi:hypothetical protein